MNDTPSAELVARARALAIERHGDQRYGVHPYSVHLAEVAAIAEPYGPEAQAIAWLHDVLEDPPTTREELVSHFGEHLTLNVELLTDPVAPNRKQRKALLHTRLEAVTADGPVATGLVVKVCDRLANVRRCISDDKPGLLQMYQREHSHFREAAYRPGLCEALWDELDGVFAG